MSALLEAHTRACERRQAQEAGALGALLAGVERIDERQVRRLLADLGFACSDTATVAGFPPPPRADSAA